MLSRRDLIRLGAAGAGFAIIGLRRKSARAATPPRAKRVLVVYHEGGMRASMAYNASTQPTLNPWGFDRVSGVVRLGKVMTLSASSFNDDVSSWSAFTSTKTVPSIADVAAEMAMVGGADHAPGAARQGDHPDDSLRMGTGYYRTDVPGLLTVLSRYLVTSSTPAPASIINTLCPLAQAPDDWLPYSPVALVPYGMPGGISADSNAAIGNTVEDALDGGLRGSLRGLQRAPIDQYRVYKGAMRQFGPILGTPALDLSHTQNFGAAVGGVTNQMLLQAVGAVTGADAGDGFLQGVALALRLLQVGSPAVVVGLPGYDTHSGEREAAPYMYSLAGRALAGIHFVLSTLPDPSAPGQSMLDTTLVVTASEFGRNSGASTYDGKDGTDHGGDDGWRYQAHVVFGAGVVPKLIAPTDDHNHPMAAPLSTQALLATIASAVGIADSDVDALWPPGTALRPEGSVLDLWS